VVREAPLLFRHEFGDVGLDVARRFAQGETEAMRDAEYVRVHGKGGLRKRHRHHDARGLASDARQRLQRLALAWNLAAEVRDEVAGGRHDVLGLHPEESAGLDQVLDVAGLRASQRLRGRVLGKECGRRLVDALVGTLRRENHGNQ